MAGVSSGRVKRRREQAYGREERIAGQLAKVGVEAVGPLIARMLCELLLLLRRAGRDGIGGGSVHGEEA